MGQMEQAITCYKQALSIAQEIGERQNEGAWFSSLGMSYHIMGQIERAIKYYQ